LKTPFITVLGIVVNLYRPDSNFYLGEKDRIERMDEALKFAGNIFLDREKRSKIRKDKVGVSTMVESIQTGRVDHNVMGYFLD
jgi:hypothetical protein